MTKFKSLLKWLVVLAILFFIFKVIVNGYDRISDYDFKFNVFFLVLSFPLFAVSIIAPTWAWLVLLKKQGCENINFFEAYRIWVYSFMGRYIPGKVALIAIRAQLCKQYNLPAVTVSNVAILEVFLFISASILISLPMQIARRMTIMGPIVIVLLAGVLFILLMQSKKFIGKIGRYIPPFRKIEPLSLSAGVIIKALFIYIVYWILRGCAVIAFLHSFIDVVPGNISQIISGYALAYVGGILAVFSPSGLGVREFAFATMLQPIYNKELAYVIAVVVRLWATIAEVLLWGALYSLSKFYKRGLKK